MAKISIIAIITILLLSFTSSGKVEKLFGELYDKDIYSGYLKTDVEGNELFYLFCVSQSERPSFIMVKWRTRLQFHVRFTN